MYSTKESTVCLYGHPIARCERTSFTSQQQIQHAEFIAHACNSYPKLLEAVTYLNKCDFRDLDEVTLVWDKFVKPALDEVRKSKK